MRRPWFELGCYTEEGGGRGRNGGIYIKVDLRTYLMKIILLKVLSVSQTAFTDILE
jgi:hypothetical protein